MHELIRTHTHKLIQSDKIIDDEIYHTQSQIGKLVYKNFYIKNTKLLIDADTLSDGNNLFDHIFYWVFNIKCFRFSVDWNNLTEIDQ